METADIKKLFEDFVKNEDNGLLYTDYYVFVNIYVNDADDERDWHKNGDIDITIQHGNEDGSYKPISHQRGVLNPHFTKKQLAEGVFKHQKEFFAFKLTYTVENKTNSFSTKYIFDPNTAQLRGKEDR